MSEAVRVLEVERLCVSYGKVSALRDVTLQVEAGSVVTVIGPNGAGKTTLLDMTCGKTKPTAGHIRFKDIELTRLSEHQIVRAGVGRKFQTPSVYEDLTVFENLEISYPEKRGVIGSLFFRRTRHVRECIHAVAELVLLKDHLRAKAGRLSHGQKQWLEIGMLLMQEPELLLLDEPVAGMSPREREQTAELLKKMSRGRSLVVIEHDMAFVRMIAHKVTVLHQGKLLAEGSMDQVQNDPKVIEVYLGH